MSELISGEYLLASGKITFEEIKELLWRGLIDIYDSNEKKLSIYNNFRKNNMRVGDFERFSYEECIMCKFINFNINNKLNELSELKKYKELNPKGEEELEEYERKEVIDQLEFLEKLEKLEDTQEKNQKNNYKKLIKFFLTDSSINLNDKSVTGKLHMKLEKTNCKIDEDTIRKIVYEIRPPKERKIPSSLNQKKIFPNREKNSYISLTSVLFSEWKNKHPRIKKIIWENKYLDEHNIQKIIIWLKEAMKKTKIDIDDEDLNKILSELYKVEVVQTPKDNPSK